MNGKVTIKTYMTDIILFDVVGYSLLSDEEQFKTILAINQQLEWFLKVLGDQSFIKKEEMVLGFAPTGDGDYVILNPRIAGYGIFLAISLRTALLQLKNQTNNLFPGLRIAVDFGTAISIKDIAGNQNFVGSGLNDCARLFSAKPDIVKAQKHLQDENYIIVSSAAFRLFKEVYSGEEVTKILNTVIQFKIGEEVIIPDKHGKEHKAHYVESHRKIAITPPKPEDMDKRLNDFIQKINKEYK